MGRLYALGDEDDAGGGRQSIVRFLSDPPRIWVYCAPSVGARRTRVRVKKVEEVPTVPKKTPSQRVCPSILGALNQRSVHGEVGSSRRISGDVYVPIPSGHFNEDGEEEKLQKKLNSYEKRLYGRTQERRERLSKAAVVRHDLRKKLAVATERRVRNLTYSEGQLGQFKLARCIHCCRQRQDHSAGREDCNIDYLESWLGVVQAVAPHKRELWLRRTWNEAVSEELELGSRDPNRLESTAEKRVRIQSERAARGTAARDSFNEGMSIGRRRKRN